MDLKKWLVIHLKQKDIIFQKIVNINDNKIIYKDKTVHLVACENLLTLKGKLKNTVVATLNNKKNIDWLISNWERLSKQSGFGVFFVDSKGKWVIYPHTHNKITDKKTLRQGIITLSENLS